MKYLVLISLLCSGTAFGASSPEEVARLYADATIRKDWHAAMSYFRTDDLKRVRAAFSGQLDWLGGEGIRQIFFNNMPIEEIKQLPDVAFCETLFSNFFAGLGAAGGSLKEFSILGLVPDGPNTTYVVMKRKNAMAKLDVENVDAIGTVRDAGQWYMTIPKPFEDVMAHWQNQKLQREAQP